MNLGGVKPSGDIHSSHCVWSRNKTVGDELTRNVSHSKCNTGALLQVADGKSGSLADGSSVDGGTVTSTLTSLAWQQQHVSTRCRACGGKELFHTSMFPVTCANLQVHAAFLSQGE